MAIKLKAIHYVALIFFSLSVVLAGVMFYEMGKGHFWYDGSVQVNRDARVVYVKEAVFDELGQAFSLKKEKLFCLFGSESEHEIHITSMVEDTANIVSQEWGRISFSDIPCSHLANETFIGTIHTHPSAVCFPSPPDVYLWGQIALAIPSTAGNGILCEDDLFTFFENPKEDGFELKTNPIVRWT